MKKGNKCIFAVVNNGFAEEAMEAAKACGATGGTIMHARGTLSKDAENAFNIAMQSDKEILMIVSGAEHSDEILKGLYQAVGTATPAQGIVFALPVDEVAGIGGAKQ